MTNDDLRKIAMALPEVTLTCRAAPKRLVAAYDARAI